MPESSGRPTADAKHREKRGANSAGTVNRIDPPQATAAATRDDITDGIEMIIVVT